jgi:hypothetical protein
VLVGCLGVAPLGLLGMVVLRYPVYRPREHGSGREEHDCGGGTVASAVRLHVFVGSKVKYSALLAGNGSPSSKTTIGPITSLVHTAATVPTQIESGTTIHAVEEAFSTAPEVSHLLQVASSNPLL